MILLSKRVLNDVLLLNCVCDVEPPQSEEKCAMKTKDIPLELTVRDAFAIDHTLKFPVLM